jgi:transmembrane sensor
VLDRIDHESMVLEQAIRWFVWLREHNVNPNEMDVFLRWKATSELHSRAYEKVEEIWQTCDGIDVLDLPWPTRAELHADTYLGDYPLILPEHRNPLRDTVASTHADETGRFVLPGGRGAQAQTKRKWLAAAAVLMVASFIASLSVWISQDADRYTTELAEQSYQKLEDGSVVTLGGHSSITVKMNASKRVVHLKHGEAYFEIAKDPQRPFIVKIGKTEVIAVGTAFNIIRRHNSATVDVIEGVVRVAEKTDAEQEPRSRELKKGEQIVVDEAGQWQQGAASIDRAVAWREGRLAYVNERLADVIEDVNRYSDRRLVLGDTTLSDMRYTGTVFSDDIDEWLIGLQKVFEVRILTLDDQVVLLKS